MKQINSLEISFLVKTLKKDLVSSKIQKVKQISEKTFSLEIYKEKKRNYFILSNQTLFLSNKTYESQLLTNVGQVLRKRLTNQIIQDIRQHEFDRIIELETKDYLLVIELFDKGNIILVNKPDNKIIIASRIRSWRDRSIRPKREYKYPPPRLNPFKLTPPEFEKQFGKKKVVRVLATDLGFGGDIAEEICKRAKIDKDSKKVDFKKLFKFIKNIDKKFKELRNINEKLKKDFKQESKKKEFGKKEFERLERIRKSQEKALEKWQKKEKEYRKIGKLLYEKFSKAKKQLDSRKRKIKINDITIEVDPKKSVVVNANVYFEKAKKAKRKIQGLKKAMKELHKKKVKVKKKKLKKKKREWYDKFRWFLSTDGFLVVAGKDAKTNEQLIRKHMKPNDLVFHTDITGSPFVLIKNSEKKKIPPQTILEAAEFCGSYSKAWKVGIAAVDVYYIKPDQVKKKGGLPTGSFMIYGKREWIRRIPVKVAIAVEGNEICYGPEDMVKRRTSKYVVVIPGETPAHEIGKKIRKKLKKRVEFERIIPYGKGQIIQV